MRWAVIDAGGEQRRRAKNRSDDAGETGEEGVAIRYGTAMRDYRCMFVCRTVSTTVPHRLCTGDGSAGISLTSLIHILRLKMSG